MAPDDGAALLASLPTEALTALAELMAAVSLDPWGVAGRSRGEANMPDVVFGPGGEGLVSYLILDDERRVWVTEVQWAG
jgi:hypothetical protein